jgi:hypothetical protein
MKNKYNINYINKDWPNSKNEPIPGSSFISKLKIDNDIYFSRFILFKYFGIKLIKCEKSLHNKSN